MILVITKSVNLGQLCHKPYFECWSAKFIKHCTLLGLNMTQMVFITGYWTSLIIDKLLKMKQKYSWISPNVCIRSYETANVKRDSQC